MCRRAARDSGCTFVLAASACSSRCPFRILPREVAKRLESREEKVRASSHRSERRQAGNLFPNRALRDLVLQRAVMIADDRIALVGELAEVLVVDPDVLREFELANQARADDECRDAAV